MKTVMRMLALVVFILSCTVIVHASPIARTYSLHTIESFTELLVSKGIIPEALSEKARELARMVARMVARSDGASSGSTEARNAEKVAVSVSQLIEYAELTYASGADIRGPLLLVKNTTEETISLEAKRRCQVVYRIYDASGVLRYDSGTEEKCATDERVTYELLGGKTRMFPVVHPATKAALEPGTYRLVLDYPGYGGGELSITIHN